MVCCDGMQCDTVWYFVFIRYVSFTREKEVVRKNDGEGSRASGIDLIGSYKISFLTSLSKAVEDII